MKKKSKATYLGKGVYSVPEASRYADVNSRTLRSWFRSKPDADRHPLLVRDFPVVEGRYALSFLDLIEIYVVGQLRERQVSMQTLRAARRRLESEFSTEHPFAHLELATEGKKILLREASEHGDDLISDAVSGQHEIPLAIKEFLKAIDYDQATELARRWHIHEGVVIDPSVSLGKPVVEFTGTTTFVVARSYFANSKNPELVADLYGIAPEQVLNAVSFEESHNAKLAA